MKRRILLVLALFLSLLSFSQFEQKVSFNFFAGGFKTFGKAMSLYDPYQMPHYKPGINTGASVQFNMNRRFSLLGEVSLMYSGKWAYRIGESDWLHYTITDTISDQTVAEGINELKLLNFSIGLVPKFYLFAVRKWNPYLFSAITFNFTRAKYTDNTWKDARRLNMLPPDDTGPYSPFLEHNTGLGFQPGAGVEFSPSDKLSFFIESCYTIILMKDENFKSEYLRENLNAFVIRTGIRLSFLKSKNL